MTIFKKFPPPFPLMLMTFMVVISLPSGCYGVLSTSTTIMDTTDTDVVFGEDVEYNETALNRTKRELRQPYARKCKCGGSVNGQDIEGCEDEMIGCAENIGCGTWHNASGNDDYYAHGCCVNPERFMEDKCQEGAVVTGNEWWRLVVFGKRGLWITPTGWTCCCEDMCNGAQIGCAFLFIPVVVMTIFWMNLS